MEFVDMCCINEHSSVKKTKRSLVLTDECSSGIVLHDWNCRGQYKQASKLLEKKKKIYEW